MTMHVDKMPKRVPHSMLSAEVTGLKNDGSLTEARSKSIGPEFISRLRGLKPDTTQYSGAGYKGQPNIDLTQLKSFMGEHFSELSVVMECPRTTQKIHALLQDYKKNNRLVMLFQISPATLAMIHPGSTAASIAKHLHPYRAGNATDHKLEDEKLLTVVWEYPQPKSGPLHPEATKLTDGSLRAAFLTKDAGNLAEFETYSDRVFDRLHGNVHAMDKNAFKRIFHTVGYQFRSSAQGAGEGWSKSRFNGTILANLLKMGLPISAGLLLVVYSINYSIATHELHHVKPDHKHDHHGASQSDDGSTYSLGN